MVVYKLTGFVEDHDARLLDVRNNLVGMQIGHKRVFGKWGSTGKKQPVELIVSIGDEIRVGSIEHDALRRDPQSLRGNLHQNRVGAGSEIGGTGGEIP